MLLSLLTYFLFYFNFELLISIHTTKFYKMNCTFLRNNCKNMPSLTQWTILSRWDSLEKTVYMEKIIPRKWDFTFVDVRSQLGEMNPFSYKQFAFAKWNTPFCRDLTQERRLSRVGWFFSYKQLLSNITINVI